MKTLSQQQKPVGFWRALKASLPVIFNKKVRNSAILPLSAGSYTDDVIPVTCEIKKVECGDGPGLAYCQCFLITPQIPPLGRKRPKSFQFSVNFTSGLPANPQISLEYQGSPVNFTWSSSTGTLSAVVGGAGPVLLKVCGSAGDLIHQLEAQVTGLIVIANVELEIGAPTFNIVKIMELANQTVKNDIP